MRSLVLSLLAVLCLSAVAARADEPASSEAAKEPDMVYVTLATNKGDILLELDNAKAPISVANFLGYVDDKFYDGLIFHRVIDGFMIQAGGFTPDMKEKKGKDPIKNEWKNGLKNVRGAIAMARTQVADSATSEFFINVKDNDFLDQPRDGAAYAVFGRVVVGMDVVDAIKAVKTTTKPPYQNVPVEPVIITTASRTDAAKAKELIAAEAAKTSGAN